MDDESRLSGTNVWISQAPCTRPVLRWGDPWFDTSWGGILRCRSCCPTAAPGGEAPRTQPRGRHSYVVRFVQHRRILEARVTDFHRGNLLSARPSRVTSWRF